MIKDKELFINPLKTCACTGHRVVEISFDREKLKGIFVKLIECGYDTFLIGMAIGFDTICFNILENLKSEYKIKLIACIPCLSQAYKFNKKQKEEYDRMLSIADEKIYISEEYDDKCMMRRNKFMVDNSSCLVSYIRRNYGGSVSTVNYAVKMDKTVISV
ncbi:MAG: DUF1273 domain-containing protein [Clostridiales bacterium]|nr:DUF1273 domain-containing protein [Clostridiales bacterium]